MDIPTSVRRTRKEFMVFQSLGWYRGYVRAIARNHVSPLTREDRMVLDEIADLLQRIERARKRE